MKTAILKICDRVILYALSFVVFFLPIYNSLASIGIGLAAFFLILKSIVCLNRPKLSWPFLAVLIFVVFSTLSVFYSNDIKESLIGLRKLWMYFFLFCAIVATLKDLNKLKFMVFVCFISTFFVSLDGVHQFFYGVDWFSLRPLFPAVKEGLARITASFHEPGSLGIHMGPMLALFSSFFLFYYSGFKRALLGIMLAIMLFILLLTLAPGAAFGFCFTIIFFFAAGNKKSLLSLFIIFMALSFIFLPKSLVSWPNGALFSSINGRIMMLEIALKMIAVHPFLGFGIHTFPLTYQKFCLPGYPFYKLVPPYAHNIYFQMIAEIGIIGFFSFLALLIIIFRKLWLTYSRAEEGFIKTLSLGLMGCFIAYLAHGMLESSLYTSQGALLFWVLLGFSVSLLNFKADIDF